MIFGKTADEERKEEQSKLASLHKKEFTKFAWIPTTLVDGRIVWFQKYQYIYRIRKSPGGTQYTCSRSLFFRWIRKTNYIGVIDD